MKKIHIGLGSGAEFDVEELDDHEFSAILTAVKNADVEDNTLMAIDNATSYCGDKGTLYTRTVDIEYVLEVNERDD